SRASAPISTGSSVPAVAAAIPALSTSQTPIPAPVVTRALPIPANQADRRPLDVVPNNSLNINLSLSPLAGLRFNIFGLYSSHASWYDSTSSKVLDVPSFFQMDATITYELAGSQLFLKAANVFTAYYYTEPGFPWRGRYFEGGLRLKVF
ncbi:MAG: TonB-dependent receptor, partial [Candidatus Aminicenantes bacterium]|nr:TonB-dependent receptor [Candidatus Aminicenantes bacterium]